MPEAVKFTEEELKQVQDMQKSYANVQNQFGQLKMAQIRLDEQEVELEESLSYIKLLANSKKDINKLISMTTQNIAHSVVTVFDYFINEGILVPQSELDKFYNNSMSLNKYELFLREVYEIQR